MKQWLDMKNKELPSLSKKKFPDFSPALALDLRRSIFRWVDQSVWNGNSSWQAFLKWIKFRSTRGFPPITIQTILPMKTPLDLWK